MDRILLVSVTTSLQFNLLYICMKNYQMKMIGRMLLGSSWIVFRGLLIIVCYQW